MANPSKRNTAAKRVTFAARAIVTYEVGLPRGCLRLKRALFWLSPYEEDLPTVVDEYIKAVTHLPISAERLSWDREVLKQKDAALESINQQFRDRIFETCWSLIDRFC